jgi:hypothetical protein
VDAFPAVLAVPGVSTDASSTEGDRARDTGLERPARGIWYTGVLYLDRFGKLVAFADAAAIFGGACRGFKKRLVPISRQTVDAIGTRGPERQATANKERGLRMNGWLKFTNAFTGWPVHVRAEHVTSVHQATADDCELQLVGGGKVTVNGQAEHVHARVMAATTTTGPKRGGKEIETR